MNKETNPSRLALCVMLTGGSHMLGAFLERAVYWSKYGNAKIPGVEGRWIANRRTWWMREVQLSSAQYDRASKRLLELNLVEKRQWWFSGRSILFLRPSATTLDFITASATWQAAYEFLENENDLASASAIPGSAVLPNSNGLSKPAKPSSAKKPNPNNIKTSHINFSEGKKLSGAHPASPSCAQLKDEPTEVVSGKKKKGSTGTAKAQAPDHYSMSATGPVTVKSLRDAWHCGMQKYYGAAVTASTEFFEFPPQEWKSLGQILQSLKCLHGPDGEEDWQAQAIDILVHAIREWHYLGKGDAKTPKYPNLAFIHEKLLSEALSNWYDAGRPPHGLDGF